MGKWTPQYVESVLTEKLRTLVTTALQETKDSGIDPSMSFDSFVEHLDTKSPFTKKLVGLLVTETAESRARSKDPDSMIVAQRTMTALRNLSRDCRTYPPDSFTRVHRRDRRGEVVPPLTDLPAPVHPFPASDLQGWEDIADEVEVNEDDEPFDGPSAVDAQIDHSLYDAYYPSLPPIPYPRRHREQWESFLSSRAYDEHLDPRVLGRTAETAGPGATSSSALSRQPSFRRAAPRPRTVDFNDFTSRVRERTRRIGTDLPVRRAPRLTTDEPMSERLSDRGGYGSGPRGAPIFARDSPSDSEEAEASTRTTGVTASLLGVPRRLVSSRLRRGGVPAPELVFGTQATSGSQSATSGGGRAFFPEGEPLTIHRSPSPLLTFLDGTPGVERVPRYRSSDPPRASTHLATPRSSTPTSVDGHGPTMGTRDVV